MYKEHPVFEKPKDENAKIWRYMDLAKFVSMLDKKALFFSRADKLGDPFEGSYPKANVKLRKTELQQAVKGGALSPDFPVDNIDAYMGNNLRKFLESASVSCWCLSEDESAALWRLYIKSDQGMAIQSTFKRLKDCLEGDTPGVFLGKVKYIDYEKDVFPTKNPLFPFICKRKSFEHEQEFRAVTLHFPPSGYDRYITIDLDVLIEKIYVAPSSPDWFLELVKSVTKKYDLDKEVIPSALDAKPLY